jgi:hypothetical protein
VPPLVSVNEHGLRELERLLATEGPKAKREMRAKLKSIAEPLARDVEAEARENISHIGLKWWRMRVGVTTKVVYVAPVERGVKTRGPDPRRRPGFADLIEDEAFTPALEKDTPEIIAGAREVLQELADEWNRS